MSIDIHVFVQNISLWNWFHLHIFFFSPSLQFPDCSGLGRGQGLVLPCLYDVLENVTNTQCRQYLNRMKAITFSDFMLIKGFYEECKPDIMEHKCGDVQNLDKKQEKVQYIYTI